MYCWKFVWICVFMTLFIQCIQQVESVYCYICTSRETKTCGYMFMLNHQDVKYVRWCTTSCYKMSAKRSDREVISRGCLPDMRTVEWCRHDRKRDVKGVMCTCNTDYCNSSTRPYSSLKGLFRVLLACVCGVSLVIKVA